MSWAGYFVAAVLLGGWTEWTEFPEISASYTLAFDFYELRWEAIFSLF